MKCSQIIHKIGISKQKVQEIYRLINILHKEMIECRKLHWKMEKLLLGSILKQFKKRDCESCGSPLIVPLTPSLDSSPKCDRIKIKAGRWAGIIRYNCNSIGCESKLFSLCSLSTRYTSILRLITQNVIFITAFFFLHIC